MEKENKSMEVVAGAKEESGVCPCMKLVEISAHAVADEFIHSIRNEVSDEFASRFADMLREQHHEKDATDVAIESLFVMMKLIDSQYGISLMKDAELQDKKRAEEFMNIVTEEITLAVCKFDIDECGY